MNFRPYLPLVLLSFAACHSTKKITSSPRAITLDTVAVSANNNPMNIYRESAPKTWDIQNTRVALNFNFLERTAEGRAWIDITPYCCSQDSLVLDAKTMEVDTVLWGTKDKLLPVPFSYRDNQLIIRRKAEMPVTISEANNMKPDFQVYVHYRAMPYADTNAGGSLAISEARGLYFINTDRKIPGKPVELWTQGETESNSHWMPTIDKPNERFTIRIELTVPDSFQTLSNGALISSSAAANGLRTDVWAMNDPIQAYAAMFAIGKYAIIKDHWRNKEVNYYVEHQFAPYAKLMFQHTPEMMEYFSNITGVPFPWNKYSQVVARDYVSGAMENTTASLFGEFMNQNAREIADGNFEDVVAHELFHQWFGDYATMESWSNLTVSESFANYSEQLWRRHYYGDAAADELAWEDLKKYLISADKGVDPQLVRYYYRDREDMFDRISYNKGGAILGYLHGLLGDTLFYRSMNRYLTENALQSTEAGDWRIAVEAATGKDWNWFFNQWYYSAGHPELDIRYDYDDAAKELHVAVRQQAAPDSSKLYRLPLKTGLIYGKELTVVDWLIKSRRETFTYPYKNGVRPTVVPDYKHWLPGTITEHKENAEWLAQYEGTKDYISKRKAIGNAFLNKQDESARSLLAAALSDAIPGIKVYTLKLLAGKEEEQKEYTRQVEFLAAQDGDRKVRAAAFTVLANWKIAGARKDMDAAIGDSSYLVAGAALEGLYNLDKDAAYIRAKALLPTDPKSTLEESVWYVISEFGAAADFGVFEESAYKAYGLRRVNLAGYLASYVTKVRDEATFKKSLNLLNELYGDEHIINYKQSIFSAALTAGEEFGEDYRKAQSAADKKRIRERGEATKASIKPWISDMKEQSMQQDLLEKAFNY